MFRSFRKGEAEDPKTYIRVIAAVLAEYPEEIVERVTDPRTGLPNTSQFLPNGKEVREACEAYMRPLRKRAEIEERQRAQVAARQAEEQRLRTAPKTGAVEKYLKQRTDEQLAMTPLPAERLAELCADDILRYGKSITISPQVRAIINSSEVAAEMLREAEAAADAAAMQRATARARRRSSGKRDAA